ncbi:ribonuclease H-like domain-containing protein [Tanacetum coccineum]
MQHNISLSSEPKDDDTLLKNVDEFGLLASKPSYIHMQPNISLSKEPKDDDALLENATDYQKLIGKLIYLTTIRPDIAYTVSCLSQFIHSPLKSHLKIALKVTRYLKSSPGIGIYVIKQFASCIYLKAYSDADWERCTDIRRVPGDEYTAIRKRTLIIWKTTKHRATRLQLMIGDGDVVEIIVDDD